MPTNRKHPGITERPGKSGVSYLASVFDSRTDERLYKTFRTLTAAKAWRSDTQAAIRSGKLAPTSALTFGEAADELIAGMVSGTVRGRGGKRYKPATIRSYRRAIKNRLRPEFGGRKLSEIRRGDLQRFIDGMASDGLKGSTIRNALDPLRVTFRRAIVREIVTENPTLHLEVPAADSRRLRIVSPEQAGRLIAALPKAERAVWATAMLAGLRRGELRGLRWGDLDLATGVIQVERGWDDEEGEIEGKTASARRAVPITGKLRDHLLDHRMLKGERPADALVFARDDGEAFTPSTIDNRAKRAWKAAELAGLTLQEGRHTFASTCIAAGLNAKALSTYMGHSNIAITFDLYGHLMPGNEAEAVGLLDAYLLREMSQKCRSRDATGADPSGSLRNGEDGAIPVLAPETA